MQVIKEKTHYDFMGKRHLFVALSILLNVMAFFLWFHSGDEKLGIDFRGGTELVVHFNDPVTAGDVRTALSNAGFQEAIVQSFGDSGQDFSLRLAEDQSKAEEKEKVRTVLSSIRPSGYNLLKEDYVGPIIGAQILRDAILAIVISLLAHQIYIGIRFDWRFGMGAIFALFHDVFISVGICLLAHKEMSGGILAALLTITGYSVNDTIIVFDRVRENIAKVLKTNPKKRAQDGLPTNLAEIMNISINETLSRTILTSLTAFFVVTTLWLFGGGAVADLAFALMVGIVAGTYSSIFIACPIVLACHREK
ncbi:MAG: protein translocase subunit SecF [Bdellovibrionota bacterium]